MSSKKDIRAIKDEDLTVFLEQYEIPSFRAKQLNEWLWKKRVISFKEMTNLSIQDRSLLETSFCIKPLEIHDSQISNDGTRKYSMKLHDNKLIESVLIPSRKRLTACVSSQVGCSLSCNFCATGKLDLVRNLTYAEIYDQVFLLNQESLNYYGKKLTNIVFMGMGEPLLNYNNVIKSISLITGKKGLGFSPKRITVSTVGIAKMIKQLADDEVKFNLAVSLHTAINEKRSKIMPINNSIPLENLREAIDYFYKKSVDIAVIEDETPSYMLIPEIVKAIAVRKITDVKRNWKTTTSLTRSSFMLSSPMMILTTARGCS